MSFSTATLKFSATKANVSTAAMTAALQAPAAPEEIFEPFGAELTSDTISGTASTVTRQLVVAFGHTGTAALAAVMRGGSIKSVSVSSAGSGYRAPPLITAPGGPGQPAVMRAFLNVQGGLIPRGGSGYTSPTLFFRGGLKLPEIGANAILSEPSCVQSLQVVKSGKGYSGKAKVQFQCELAPGGRLPTATLVKKIPTGGILSVFLTDTGAGLLTVPKVFIWDPGPTGNGSGGGSGAVVVASQLGVGEAATGTLTVGAGIITTVTIAGHGGPYVTLPRMLVVDTTGVQAELTPSMGIKQVDVLFGGTNYQGPPTLVQTDLFTSLFGNTDPISVAAPFKKLGWLVTLEKSVGGPIVAAAPILA